LEADESAGIATPLIVDVHDVDKVWSLGASVDRKTGSIQRLQAGRPAAELAHVHPLEVEIAPGSAMLVRSTVFERAGFMDERYFLYFEEADWCIAVQKSGYKIIAVPQACVQHRTSATLGQYSAATDYYMARNRIHFIKRHWRGAQRTRLVASAYLRQAAAMVVFSELAQRPETAQPHRSFLCVARRPTGGEMARMARICFTTLDQPAISQENSV
jgi:GT2 family glycosyltransferase